MNKGSNKLLVLDNYDSFTYNLVQYLEYLLEGSVDVFRNDAINLEEVGAYDAIVLSPGPGLPKDAGLMPELIQRYAAEKIILGVCLGHQAIGEAFGCELENLSRVYHGVEHQMNIADEDEVIFQDLPNPFSAGRYHSWVINKESLSADFIVTARDNDGEIMAMRHKQYNLRGVQFHPESIMTTDGIRMLANWLSHCAGLSIRSAFENPAQIKST